MKKVAHLVSVGSVIGQHFNWSIESIIAWAKKSGFDGVELRAQDFFRANIPLNAKIPKDVVIGLHLSDWAEWTLAWTNQKDQLIDAFGSLDVAEQYLPGSKKQDLIDQWKKEISLGQRIKARYFVFHASEISYNTIFDGKKKSNEAVISIVASAIAQLDCPELIIENAPPHEAGVHTANDFSKLTKITGPLKVVLDTSHLQSTLFQNGKGHQTEDLVNEIADIVKNPMIDIMSVHLSESSPRQLALPVLDDNWDFWEKRRQAGQYLLDDHLPVGQFLKDPIQLIEAAKPSFVVHELKGNDFQSIEKALFVQQTNLNSKYHK